MKFFLLFFTFISFLDAKVDIVVSVLPQVTFTKAIGGDKVNIELMVKPGNSPHTYEPKPSQMRYIAKANIYFTIGVEFEKVWLPKFTNQNHKMKVIDLSNNIKGKTKDPHIWTSPDYVKIIANNIYDSLIKIDNKNQKYYHKNYINFLQHIEKTDTQIKKILQNTPKGTKFMVFHPAWGYFAKEYNLIQIPIEIDGKNPKPRQITHLIKEARAEKITAILTAPEFSTKIATQIAKELKIKVIKITPLNPQWSKNLIKLAKTIK
jgi:zinc transport system substrate-binding protein